VLTRIENQVVYTGDAVSFAASHYDADRPNNSHTLSLDGAPAGATIESTEGLSWFRWPDAIAGFYTFDVVVTDDGSPPMEDRESVSIWVIDPATLPNNVSVDLSVLAGDPEGDGIVGLGEPVTLRATITETSQANMGASDTTLTLQFLGDVTLIGASPDVCTLSTILGGLATLIRCPLGTVNGSMDVDITVTLDEPQVYDISATVGAANPDPYPANNNDSVQLDIRRFPLSWSVTVTSIEQLVELPVDWFVKVWLNPDGDYTQIQPTFTSDLQSSTKIEPFWTVGETKMVAEGATVSAVIEVWTKIPVGTNFVPVRLDVNSDPNEEALFIDVDPATGAWSGDVTSPARCSTQDARVCFDVSVLSESGDFDGDGFLDGMELFGLDVDGDGVVDLDLPGLGADPCRKTLATEIDYMDSSITGIDHKPLPGTLTALTDAFDAAPIPVATGCSLAGFPTAPRGVNLLIDIDDAVPEQAGKFSFANGNFEPTRADYFDERLLPYVYYSLWIHARMSGSDYPTESTVGGQCCRDGGSIISLGNWPKTVEREAITFMHEFGHALGLEHGGSEKVNLKPNYLSIMNYWFGSGLTDSADPSTLILDYSREALPSLDETALVEEPLSDSTLVTAWFDSDFDKQTGPLNQPFDWDGDGTIGVVTDPVDLNGDSRCVTDGSDNVLDTVPAGDDVVVPMLGTQQVIVSGSNETCDTIAAGDPSDDVQKGGWAGRTSHTDLAGSDDWANIKYRTAAYVNGDAVSADPPDHTDITLAEALELDEFWAAVRLALANTPPEISVTTNQTPEISLADGSVVLEGNTVRGWSGDLAAAAGVTASDHDPEDVVALTSDAPDVLPIGDTSVRWTATDSGGATTSKDQVITVVDTTSPTIDTVEDISVVTTESTGTVVEFTTPLATDTVDPAPQVNCEPPSGWGFPVGVTEVMCTATDQSSNAAMSTFTVEATFTVPTAVAASGTIGDTVWSDENNNGIQDNGEKGIAGATVRLTLPDGTTIVATTDAGGAYLFSALEAGTYTSELILSSISDSAEGSLNLTTPGSFTIRLQDGESYLDADFGVVATLLKAGIDADAIPALAIALAIALALLIAGAAVVLLTIRRREGGDAAT